MAKIYDTDAEWVAVKGREVIGEGETIEEAREEAKEAGYEKFAVTANSDGGFM